MFKRPSWPFRGLRGASAAASSLVLAVLGGMALAQQDKYTLQVPNGLAFSEFRGYETWQVVSVSHDGPLLAAILANPVMIDAYSTGIPGNGKPFPDGAKLAKIHWNPKKMETFPAAASPGSQDDVDFILRASVRFRVFRSSPLSRAESARRLLLWSTAKT